MDTNGGDRLLKVGLIGLGKAGLRHAAAIGLDRGSVVVAAADPGEAAADNARDLGIPLHRDHNEMLREHDLDAAVISVPHSLLSQVARDCAAQGVHILLEKPMATRRADAEAVLRACRESGVRLMINFVHRFRSEVREARRLIQNGAIGRPVLAVDIMASGESHIPDWVWRPDTGGGGMMMYNGIHGVDRLAWLVDSPVVEVSAESGTYSHPVAVEDNLAGILRFESGSLGAIVQHKSAASATLEPWHTTVFGTSGAIRISKQGTLELTTEHESVRWETTLDDRFRGAFQEFSTSINEQRDPSPSGADGLLALSVVLALYEAARTASTVSLSRS